MLNELSIKNVAVIDRLSVEFGGGLSVLTGETGAGKSIIIDSINMILGSRANKELVRYGTEKASVQAVFDVNGPAEELLKENDIDTEDGQIIISRTVTAEGKSAAKINGVPVTLSALRDIADALINIHGQHDNQALLTPSKHTEFLDGYGKTHDELERYRKLYEKRRAVRNELKSLETDEQEKMQRMDLLEYQIREISSAALEDGEEEELLRRRDICRNAERVSEAVDGAYANLYDNGEMQSAYDGLSIAVDALSDIEDLSDELRGICETLRSAMYSVEDSAHELASFRDSVEFDEETLNETEERLDIISKLKRKYGKNIAEINAFADKARAELDKITMSGELTEKLTLEFKELTEKLKKAAAELSAARSKAAAELESKIETALHELNMDKSKFRVVVEPAGEFRHNGADRVEFMISTNPGEPLKPLVKIASGGELSRVMLAIKSIIAESDSVDTMIFDEIDTGVSGNTALKIANKLALIGKAKQVICITHLPQLTAAADNHYLIEKNTDGDMAATTLRRLDDEGRVTELARIIDGGDITETAINHAKELLKRK